jgi:hypothetical protein
MMKRDNDVESAQASELEDSRGILCQRHVRCAEGSADFLTPSPPAKKKKTTARQDQAEQSATVLSGNGKVDNQRVTRCRCKRQHTRERAQNHTFHDPLLSGYAT